MAKMQIWKFQGSTTLTVARPKHLLIKDGLIDEGATIFASFEADIWLEACEQYSLILGHGPYIPMKNEKGKPEHWYFTRIEDYKENE